MTIVSRSSLHKKLFFIFMGAILLITASLLYLSHTQHAFVLDVLSKEERQKTTRIYEESIRSMEEKYRLIGQNLLSDPAVVESVREHDRIRLMGLTATLYKQLTEHNPHFEIMHFHTADTHSLLRLHRPERFGDDLSDLRPMIEAVNTSHRFLSGLEVGKYGISHRIALPITDPESGENLGVLEMGIDAEYIVGYLKERFDIDSTVILNKEALHTYFSHMGTSDRYRHLDGHVIFRSSVDDLITYDNLDTVLQTNCRLHTINDEDKLILNATTLRAFDGEEVGNMILIKDMGFYTDQIRLIRILNIVLAVILVVFSFWVLRFSYRRFSRQVELFHERLLQKNRSLTKLSNMDHLTKLYNRRKTEELLKAEHQSSLRHHTPLSVIIFDVDNFKQINDTLGHHVGDKVLRSLSKLVSHSIRDTDHLGRWGGEEFLLVASGTTCERAGVIAEKIRLIIANHDFDEAKRVTCSFGVREFHDEDTVESALQHADQALYKAKDDGRNRVVLSGPSGV